MQRTHLEAAFPARHLAPVAHNHVRAPLHEKENLLVIAMAVQPYAAARIQQMQIHVIDGEEVFPATAIVLDAVRIKVPRLERPAKLTASRVASVVRQQVSILQETDAAVRIGTHADAEIVVPPAQDHIELVL